MDIWITSIRNRDRVPHLSWTCKYNWHTRRHAIAVEEIHPISSILVQPKVHIPFASINFRLLHVLIRAVVGSILFLNTVTSPAIVPSTDPEIVGSGHGRVKLIVRWTCSTPYPRRQAVLKTLRYIFCSAAPLVTQILENFDQSK